MTDRVTGSPTRRSRSGMTRTLDSYGLVLGLIIVSIVLMAALGDSRWADAALVVTLGVTLLAAMRASNVRTRVLRLTTWLLVPALAVAVLSAVFGGEDFAVATANCLAAGIAIVAPVIIVRRLVQHPAITVRTVLGALCVYLLLGFFFSFLFSVLGRVAGPFFAQPGAARAIDYVYFSYVTMSTVGYGDLTARSDLGRMLAVTEALIGQLYLVTIVALLVGNLGRQRRQAGG